MTSATDYQPGAASESIQYVLVGYSGDLLTYLDLFLPADSVLVVEEPEVIRNRGAQERVADFRCVVGILAAPAQDEDSAEKLPSEVSMPPHVRAVVPAHDYAVVAAASLAQAWGRPGAGIDAARVFRDKSLLRETAGKAGIAQPEWLLACSAAEVADFRAKAGGRCVIKPTNRQSSEGVQLLGPDDDVAAAWDYALAGGGRGTVMRAEHFTHARCLVERMLDGPEMSAELLLQDGQVRFFNATLKRVLPGRHPVEMGHVVPGPDAGGVSDRLKESMCALAEAAGFSSGLMHGEWIIEDGVPQLVECAGRLPGDHIHKLIELAYDWDLLRNWFAVLQGDPPVALSAPVRGSAIRFLSAPPGRVHAIHGVDQARTLRGVHSVAVQVAAGDTVEAVRSSWERLGYVIATGADGAAAERVSADAQQLVTIETLLPPEASRHP
ncbi:MAG TPA: ATP-grasp domain-containing protein [Jatrophihabitans sp.]|uniref:ATP-grasp domain-containing protein n=1 Tax=Jatrophihabitans sp. TaxID=1932789 RepID=UPI002F1F72BF